jgi:hypothetical protein
VAQLQTATLALQEYLQSIFNDDSDFNETLDQVIHQLKELGHTMYRLDYDSDIYRFRETWGSHYFDYGANGLEIEFISPNKIHVAWVTSSKNTQENQHE